MHEMNFRKHWETIRLEEIADIRAGSAFPIKYQGNVEGKYPFYKVSDMNLTGNETLMHASNNWVEEDTVEPISGKRSRHCAKIISKRHRNFSKSRCCCSYQ